MKKIQDEFRHLGFFPDEQLTGGTISRAIEESAKKMIRELNARSSMRETQGAGDSYFTHPSINRAVYNQPFKDATVKTEKTGKTEYKTSVQAIVKSTKGNSVNLIDVIQSGRPRKEMPSKKRIVFPATQKSSGRLIKKRIGNVDEIPKIFRVGKAKYKKIKGRLALVSLDYLPEVKGRDILGVIARNVEKKISKKKVKIPSLGISGEIGKGLIKVKADK